MSGEICALVKNKFGKQNKGLGKKGRPAGKGNGDNSGGDKDGSGKDAKEGKNGQKG